MAARDIAERRKNRILVVRIIRKLPAHRGMLHRQSCAHLPPSFAAILAAIDAAVDPARPIPILRRAMPGGQKHCRPIAGQINHVMKVIALHPFFGAFPSLLRRIGPEKATRRCSKIFCFAAR